MILFFLKQLMMFLSIACFQFMLFLSVAFFYTLRTLWSLYAILLSERKSGYVLGDSLFSLMITFYYFFYILSIAIIGSQINSEVSKLNYYFHFKQLIIRFSLSESSNSIRCEQSDHKNERQFGEKRSKLLLLLWTNRYY